MRTRNAYRFRIYPSEEQGRILERTLQTCRILYNNLLAERRDAYREIDRSPSYYEQKRGLTKRRLITGMSGTFEPSARTPSSL